MVYRMIRPILSNIILFLPYLCSLFILFLYCLLLFYMGYVILLSDKEFEGNRFIL